MTFKAEICGNNETAFQMLDEIPHIILLSFLLFGTDPYDYSKHVVNHV